MNVLQINTHDVVGGAARAMYRLHCGLEQSGNRSQVLANVQTIVDPGVHKWADVAGSGRTFPRRLSQALGMRADAWFGWPSFHGATTRILASDLFRQAQVVNLHNIHGQFFDYRLLPRFAGRKPVVWTLHDMWALTGHCAYAYDCRRWMSGCFDCPLQKEPQRRFVEPPPTYLDRTRPVWRSKRRLYQKSPVHIVAPSRWLSDLVRESILAHAQSIQCIPNGLDLDVFQPRDQAMARQALDVPLEARVLLFVSQSVTLGRKGFRYVLDALERLEDTESLFLLTVGTQGAVGSRLDRFRCRDLGALSDERLMSLVYSAADVFVFPTLADNQPLVLIEAMACGTPLVSFDVGGVPEMVRHMETGYLARYQDVEDLARGIQRLLDDQALATNMGRRCREIAVREYSLDLQVQRYADLYRHALELHARKDQT